MMNDLWVEVKNDFLALDRDLQIRWLSEFSSYLTVQFRIIFHEEIDVNMKLSKLYSINEINHQIFPQIGRKIQNINSYHDDLFIDYLYKSTEDLDISMLNFLKSIKNIKDWD
ncbi:MAG: hypothetical protein GAK29_01154 [Acinetobacter bereziniae]|uniref:Uncharacterized protein n=1 Tax=Acinetobacter bereziniae TaxID=106648 RepID=A0A833URC0_ACIBZ|nr:MAG: hypothetical protein GAK29_01154 [Acinetobacter bereziniae]